MTKDELRTGMQVDLKNGLRCMVMRDTIIGDFIVSMDESLYYSFSSFRNSLDNTHSRNFDIVCVYETTVAGDFLNKISIKYKLWSREPKINVKVEINGKNVLPSEISKEEWNNIRENN